MRGSLVITPEKTYFRFINYLAMIRTCLPLGVALAEEKTCSARINPIPCILNRSFPKLAFMGGVVQVPRATPYNFCSLSYAQLLPNFFKNMLEIPPTMWNLSSARSGRCLKNLSFVGTVKLSVAFFWSLNPYKENSDYFEHWEHLMKCPRCETEVDNPAREWDYRNNYYHVKSYKCSNCRKTFMVFYHNNKFSHTIPKMN